MKRIICVRGTSCQGQLLLARLCFIDGDTPPNTTNIQGIGTTAEEAMGALVMAYGNDIPELQEFRQRFHAAEVELQYVGEQLMATAKKAPGMIIGIMIDTSTNWPKEDASTATTVIA